jgi:hypothetical protein
MDPPSHHPGMTDLGKSPRSRPSAPAVPGRRQERLAAALRANLARRKAQARERNAAASPPAEPPKARG